MGGQTDYLPQVTVYATPNRWVGLGLNHVGGGQIKRLFCNGDFTARFKLHPWKYVFQRSQQTRELTFEYHASEILHLHPYS